MAKLADYRTGLLAAHHSEPQTIVHIQTGFQMIEAGLAALARLGHVFHLEPGSADSEEIWPRVYFHEESAPNGRSVASPWELAELGGRLGGWYRTQAEAQNAAGVAAQFAGRAGLRRERALPMIVEGAGGEAQAPADGRRSAIIAEFKSRKGVTGT